MEISPALSLTPSHSDCVLASMHSLEIMTSFCPLFVRMTITSEPTTFCPYCLNGAWFIFTRTRSLSFSRSLIHSLTHTQTGKHGDACTRDTCINAHIRTHFPYIFLSSVSLLSPSLHLYGDPSCCAWL